MRIWNCISPRARVLQRVVLLGGNAGRCAEPADGVPVEVLRSRELEACKAPRTFYPLNPGALIFQSVEGRGVSAEKRSRRWTGSRSRARI